MRPEHEMIYIRQCKTNYSNYNGSLNEKVLEKFYTQEELDHRITKFDVIDNSNDSKELNRKEIYYINKYQSNNPTIGFNIRPKFNGDANNE